MNKKAFTLIELSIVLIIVGLLIGGSLKFTKIIQERAKVSHAKQDVKSAVNAILGYAISTQFLPSKTTFIEQLSPIKGNQHQLLYVHDTALESKNICSFITTALKVKVDDFNGSTHTINNVAFIVVSESANMNMQTALSSDTVEIRKPYETIDDQPDPINKAEPYDDVSQWITLTELQNNINCAQTPLRIVNTSLPDTNTLDSSSYVATIIIDGNYSEPSSSSCSFSDSLFSYDDTSMTISHDSTNSNAGTVSVTCSVTVDNKTVKKNFAITVNDASSSNGINPAAGGNGNSSSNGQRNN